MTQLKSLKEVQDKIDEHTEVKEYHKKSLKENPRVKRNIIKVINKELHKLYLLRQQFASEGNGMRGDPAPTEEIKEDDNYVYAKEPKKKRKSGDNRRAKESAINKRLIRKKRKQEYGL